MNPPSQSVITWTPAGVFVETIIPEYEADPASRERFVTENVDRFLEYMQEVWAAAQSAA